MLIPLHRSQILKITIFIILKKYNMKTPSMTQKFLYIIRKEVKSTIRAIKIISPKID